MKFSQWISLGALIAAFFVIWGLKEVFMQVFAGIILAMALCTLIGKVQLFFSISRKYAVIISLLCIGIVFSIGLILVVPPFIQEFQELIRQLPSATNEFWQICLNLINRVSDIFYGDNSPAILEKIIISEGFNPLPDSTSFATGVADSIKKILGLASNLGIGFVQLIIVLVISIMVALQPVAYREVAILLVPSFYRRRARSILIQCGNSLSNWMQGVLLSSLLVAFLAGIGLYLLGIKLVIANALLAGILNIIPNVGPTISTIFPISVALLDEPIKAIAVLALYIIIQNIESYLITPSVMHYQVKLLPALTLIAQFVFTIAFGPIGLLLAIPLAVVIQVLVREVLIHDFLDKWKQGKYSN